MSHHLLRGLERLTPLASSKFIVKQTIITACLPPWVVPSASTPLDSGVVPYFQPLTASHFSSFHRRSFSSATLTPPGKSISGSEMRREWSPARCRPAQPQRTELLHPTPIDILSTPQQNIFLLNFTPIWLFVTPCAFSLPDFHPISESAWLARQFHRISHAKRDPREEEGLLSSSAHSARSPSEALI